MQNWWLELTCHVHLRWDHSLQSSGHINNNSGNQLQILLQIFLLPLWYDFITPPASMMITSLLLEYGMNLLAPLASGTVADNTNTDLEKWCTLKFALSSAFNSHVTNAIWRFSFQLYRGWANTSIKVQLSPWGHDKQASLNGPTNWPQIHEQIPP